MRDEILKEVKNEAGFVIAALEGAWRNIQQLRDALNNLKNPDCEINAELARIDLATKELVELYAARGIRLPPDAKDCWHSTKNWAYRIRAAINLRIGEKGTNPISTDVMKDIDEWRNILLEAQNKLSGSFQQQLQTLTEHSLRIDGKAPHNKSLNQIGAKGAPPG